MMWKTEWWRSLPLHLFLTHAAFNPCKVLEDRGGREERKQKHANYMLTETMVSSGAFCTWLLLKLTFVLPYMCSLENLSSPMSHLYPTKTLLYLLGTNNSRGAPHIIYREIPSHFLGLLDQNLMTSTFQLSHMDDIFLHPADTGACFSLKDSGSTSPFLTSSMYFAPSSGLPASHHLTSFFS